MKEDAMLLYDLVEEMRALVGVVKKSWPYRGTLADLEDLLEQAYHAVSRLNAAFGQMGGNNAEVTNG